jgi:DNA polymerase III delta prime subunit
VAGSDVVVGRVSEVGALSAFVERAGDGPYGLLLEGEPGVGKTTLWLEGVALARAHGRRVLVARPAEAEARLGLAGIADLLDGVIDELVAGLPGPQADALKVALLLERPGGGVADDRAVATAVLNALRLLSGERAVLVAIDDVQWLDAASAGVLAYVWRRLGGERVSVLVTRREGARSDVFSPVADRRVSVLGLGG